MKRIFCLAVAMVILLFAFVGCEQSDPTENTATGGNGTVIGTGEQLSSGTNSTMNNTTEPSEPVVVIPPTAPENPGNTIIPFDPDREIYLLYDNQEFTIYKGFTSLPSIGVYIFSKNELDVNSISLEPFAKSDYTVTVGEIPLEGIVNMGVGQRTEFTYELYQCYMGKDFAKLWELEKAYKESYEAFEKEEIGYEEFHAAEQAYISYRDAEKDSYLHLTKADLPSFHVYYATAIFFGSEFFEETITEAQLRYGDQVCTLMLGEIKITMVKLEFPADLDWYNGGGYAYDGIIGSGNTPLPYNGGIHRIEGYFSFTAEHAMTLTGLQLDNPNHKLEAAWIDLVSADGFSYSGQWDLSEPFLLMPGDRVRIHIAYRDEGLHSLSYATKVWGYLIYEWEKGTSCKLSECDVRRASDVNFYETYAIIFEGLDLESYYRDYYYPKYEPWRVDPEKNAT